MTTNRPDGDTREVSPPASIEPPRFAGRPSRRAMRRAPFAALVVMILGVGLVGSLLVNTTMSQGAFALQDLQQQSSDLAETQQSLEQQLARMQSPAELAERARALGMVQSEHPVFLDLKNGGVEGVAVEATAPPPPPTTPPPSTTPATTRAGTTTPGTTTPGTTTPGTTTPAGTAPPASPPPTTGAPR